MPIILYDIRSAPINTADLGMMAYMFVMFTVALLVLYLGRKNRNLPHQIFYISFALIITVTLALVVWYRFERRSECIEYLNQGQAQVIEGTLTAFNRIYIKGKFTPKEVRFTVNGKEFIEENIEARTCGAVKRFTELNTPKVGTVLRVTYLGDAILQVIALSSPDKNGYTDTLK